MNISFEDKDFLLDCESWDLESEILEVISEMTEDEKQSLLNSEDLPECVLHALSN